MSELQTNQPIKRRGRPPKNHPSNTNTPSPAVPHSGLFTPSPAVPHSGLFTTPSPAVPHSGLFSPSSEQQTIIDGFKRGENIAVNAVAGSGKTTTILGIASQLPTKKILQITYNRALKLEVEKKVALHNLTNLKILTYHGLACAFYDYSCWTDERIQILLRNNTPLKPSLSAATLIYDIVIIDEIQDMTPLYFELVHKFLADIKCNVNLGIMGDHLQGIYGYKGADERFLTHCEAIFTNHQPFHRYTLNTSYRLTQPMAEFVNKVMMPEPARIKSVKPGPPVMMLQYPQKQQNEVISKLIIDKIRSNQLKNDDIFILAPSIKSSGAVEVKELENILVANGILCFVPISEDSKLDEKVIKNKVVFTTMHQSKGRERKLVIVYGFDTSYYSIFKDKTASLQVCPNLLYVAATRASEQLILVEGLGREDIYRLPFLKMSDEQMHSSPFIQIARHYLISGSQEIMNKINGKTPYTHQNSNRTPPVKSVSELTRYIDDPTLAILADMVKRVFTQITPPTDATTISIPSDIKTGPRTYEQIADINGITIPAILFNRVLMENSDISHTPMRKHNPDMNFLWRYLKKRYNQKQFTASGHIIMKYVKELAEKGCNGINTLEQWLLLGNVFLCANEGYIYKLAQIKEYNWLSNQMIAICHSNIEKHISPDTIKESFFELEIGNEYDFSGYYICNHTLGSIKIRGRVDCITPDTIWEFKCSDSLNLENMLQLIMYSWIWRKSVEYEEHISQTNSNISELSNISISIMGDNLENNRENYNAYLEREHKTNKKSLFHMKECKIMNIRTGEVLKLDTTSHLIDEIVDTIISSKLRVRETLTDADFIAMARAKIEKFIINPNIQS